MYHFVGGLAILLIVTQNGHWNSETSNKIFIITIVTKSKSQLGTFPRVVSFYKARINLLETNWTSENFK